MFTECLEDIINCYTKGHSWMTVETEENRNFMKKKIDLSKKFPAIRDFKR